MYSELLQSDLEDSTLGTLCRGANFLVMLTQAIEPAWASERLEDHPPQQEYLGVQHRTETHLRFLSDSINSDNDVSSPERIYFSFSE